MAEAMGFHFKLGDPAIVPNYFDLSTYQWMPDAHLISMRHPSLPGKWRSVWSSQTNWFMLGDTPYPEDHKERENTEPILYTNCDDATCWHCGGGVARAGLLLPLLAICTSVINSMLCRHVAERNVPGRWEAGGHPPCRRPLQGVVGGLPGHFQWLPLCSVSVFCCDTAAPFTGMQRHWWVLLEEQRCQPLVGWWPHLDRPRADRYFLAPAARQAGVGRQRRQLCCEGAAWGSSCSFPP